MKINNTYTLANKIFREYLNLLKLNKIDIILSWWYPIKSNLLLDSFLINELNVSKKNGIEKFRYWYWYWLDEKSINKSIVDYENNKHSCNYENNDIVICQSASYWINRIIETFIWKLWIAWNITIIWPTFFRMLNKLEYTPWVNNLNVVNWNSKKLFSLNKEELLSVINQTKIIFMCNPINPTYKFVNNNDLLYIYNLCIKYWIYLIIDETWDALWNKEVFYPFDLNSENIIRLRSLSKTNLLAENRLALIFSKNKDLIKNLKNIIWDDMSNVSFSSHNAIKYIFDNELISNDKSLYIINKKDNINKINYLKQLTINFLKTIDNVVEIIEPETCFNILFKFKSKKFETDFDFAKHLIEYYSTSVAPWSWFWINPLEKFIRITYVVDKNMLINGLNNIKNALWK